jgi:hypothetical protein
MSVTEPTITRKEVPACGENPPPGKIPQAAIAGSSMKGVYRSAAAGRPDSADGTPALQGFTGP